jgi:hypothetical protein
MSLYLTLKPLRILPSTILFGTGLGSACCRCAPGSAAASR